MSIDFIMKREMSGPNPSASGSSSVAAGESIGSSSQLRYVTMGYSGVMALCSSVAPLEIFPTLQYFAEDNVSS
jgi:hypothetical protein